MCLVLLAVQIHVSHVKIKRQRKIESGAATAHHIKYAERIAKQPTRSLGGSGDHIE